MEEKKIRRPFEKVGVDCALNGVRLVLPHFDFLRNKRREIERRGNHRVPDIEQNRRNGVGQRAENRLKRVHVALKEHIVRIDRRIVNNIRRDRHD